MSAALALRGLEKQDLAPLVAKLKDDYNVAAHNPAKASREGDPLEPTPAMGRVAAAALGLPEKWFLADDFDAWISRGDDAPELSAQTRLLEMVSRVGSAVEANQRAIQELQQELQQRPVRQARGGGNG